MSNLSIEFTEDALESFDTIAQSLMGYYVEVVTDEGETMDVLLVRVDHDAGWHGSLIVRRLDDNYGPVGDEFRVAATKVVVF